jgi:hypothetical protein
MNAGVARVHHDPETSAHIRSRRAVIHNRPSAWVPGVTGIIIAAALGGALAYFLDPENGPRRRQSVLYMKLRARDAANETSEAVEEVGVPGRG